MLFNESLIKRETPFAACAAFEEYVATGGKCNAHDPINWAGIAFTATMKAEEESEPLNLACALGWAHLAILIHNEMAKAFPPGEIWGFEAAAMRIRMNMIIRYGNHSGDPICDSTIVLRWCLATPGVQSLLKKAKVPPYSALDPEVREAVEIMTILVKARRIEETGDAALFLNFIKRSRDVK